MIQDTRFSKYYWESNVILNGHPLTNSLIYHNVSFTCKSILIGYNVLLDNKYYNPAIMKNIKFALLVIALATINYGAWLAPDGDQSNAAYYDVIETQPEFTIIRFKIPRADTGTVIINGDEYSYFEVPGMGRGAEAGAPAVNAFSFLLHAAKGRIDYTVIQKQTTTIKDFRLVPEMEPQPDKVGWEAKPPEPDPSIYTSSKPFPEDLARDVYQAVIRGAEVHRIKVFPIVYHPGRQELEIIYDLTVRIEHSQPPAIEERIAGESHINLLRDVLVNPVILRTPRGLRSPEPESSTGAEYLIITTQTLSGAAQTLAAWKNRCGIDTEVRTTVETGTSASAIRSYIQNAYDTWTPAPEYLLIIGDAENVPTNYTSDDHPYHGTPIGTDLYYVTTDGSDYYPEIFYGRLLVQNLTQANMAVNRIIDYEKVTYSLGSDFYNHATCAAYFQDSDDNGYADRRFAQTSEDIRNFLISDGYTVDRIYYTESWVDPTNWNTPTYSSGEPIPSELRKPGFPWDGTDTDISNAVNNGRFLLSHRDHGYRNGWGDPAYDEDDVYALTNANEFPVVMSINCETGWFDNETDESGDGTDSSDECFCEAWWRNSSGGAVGVIGATRVSYSGYNDYLAMGFIDGIWDNFNTSATPDPPTEGRLGFCLTYAKYYMENYWEEWDLEWEIFHWYGDPTMRLWREEPEPLSATHPSNVAPGSGNIDVTVTCLGSPVDGATVCITDDANVWSRGTTNSSGYVNIVYSGAIGGSTLYVTATARDKKPYQGTITVNSTLPEASDLVFPFDNARIGDGASSTTPTMEWLVPNDPDDDDLHFGVRWDDDAAYGSPIFVESHLNTSGFSPTPPLPDATGSCSYTVNSQSEGAMSNGETYWWGIIARDDGAYGNPSESRSMTIDNSRTDIDWHQTTTEQFQQGTGVDVEIASDKVHVTGVNMIFEDDFESYSSQAEFEAEWTVNGSNVYWSTSASVSPSHCIYIDDGDAGSAHYMYHSFSALSTGFMSVWSGVASSSDEGELLRFYDSSGNRKGQIYYREGYVAYWDGTNRTNLQAIDAGNWHHYRVDFDESAGEIFVTIDEASTYGPFSYMGTPAPMGYVMCGPRGYDSYTGDFYFDDVQVGESGGTGEGSITSPPIVFDWNPGFSAWDQVTWTEGADDSVVVVLEERSGGSWMPSDSGTASASAMAGTLDISGLGSTDTIRLRAKLFSKSGNDPDLFDWSVEWRPAELGVEIYKGGPTGPLYHSSSWDIGMIDEGDSIVMSAGDCAYILNTGTVPMDIRIKAETSGSWTFGDVQGSDQMLLMGVFDQEGSPPPVSDFNTPMDRIHTLYRTSGATDGEPFASPRSSGVDVTVGTGRYLYLMFAAPNPNTRYGEQAITVSIEIISS